MADVEYYLRVGASGVYSIEVESWIRRGASWFAVRGTGVVEALGDDGWVGGLVGHLMRLLLLSDAKTIAPFFLSPKVKNIQYPAELVSLTLGEIVVSWNEKLSENPSKMKQTKHR